MGFDKLKSTLQKMRATLQKTRRGTADVSSTVDEARASQIPEQDIQEFGNLAARSCTWLCRKFILENMSAAGLDSKNLRDAVGKAIAHMSKSRGEIRLAMPREEKDWKHVVKTKAGKRYEYEDKREEGPYVMQAALDAGAVYGLGSKSFRAKRSLKSGIFNNKTTRAVRQKHMVEGKWKTFERGAIDLGSVRVRPGMNFWKFSAAQAAQINEHFKKNFWGLVNKRRPNATT